LGSDRNELGLFCAGRSTIRSWLAISSWCWAFAAQRGLRSPGGWGSCLCRRRWWWGCVAGGGGGPRRGWGCIRRRRRALPLPHPPV